MKVRFSQGPCRFVVFRRRPGRIRTIYLDDEEDDVGVDVLDLGCDLGERDAASSGYRWRH